MFCQQNGSLYFGSLECTGCWWVGGGDLGQKVLFRVAEISSVVYLVKFKDGGPRVSCLYCFG